MSHKFLDPVTIPLAAPTRQRHAVTRGSVYFFECGCAVSARRTSRCWWEASVRWEPFEKMEEQQRLLDDSDDEDYSGPTADIRRLIRRQRGRKSAGDELHPGDLNFRDSYGEDPVEDDANVPDNVVCMFVVAFDTRQG